MVCIAAFIILILVGVIVAFLSIFNRTLGRKYLKILKKSWYCFSHRVTLRKCDTSFAEDVKTSILKKVVIKKPQWVKPLSIVIEAVSVVIVVITVWSIVEGAKAGLALWTLGTCNVSQPSNCALGADSCSLDEENLNWFEEWGEIFAAIPDRLKKWDATAYDFTPAYTLGDTSKSAALAIVDPGCSVCMQSYKNIKDSDFLNDHYLIVVSYPIINSNGSLRYQNAELITRYMLAAGNDLAQKIIDRIFTEYNDKHINYQSVMNTVPSEEAEKLLQAWLKEWTSDDKKVKEIIAKINSDDITKAIEKNRQLVNDEIKPKGIPTFIYDGKKHLGLYKK